MKQILTILFKKEGESIRAGVQKVGEDRTPAWLKIGCLGSLSIPIVGG